MSQRCPWAQGDPLMEQYHDTEWGVPLRDDRKLYEFLVLDAAQAGLSWRTILYKRAGYQRAFAAFDPAVVAGYGEADTTRLLADPGIVRNRLKVAAAIRAARLVLEVQRERGSLSSYLWQFSGGAPIVHTYTVLGQLLATSGESDAMSKALKARGFTFVGSTICYAFMQAAGMVNDHLVSCPRHGELAAMGAK